MNKKKTIAVAIVLALVLLIGGLLAYFTDTDTKTNVFTLGDNIEISLNESNWDATKGAGIHPGAVVPKNPVIKNDSKTTPAYVFAEVIVPCYDKDGDGTLETPLFSLDNVDSSWNLMSTGTVDQTAKTIKYVYNYGTESAMTTLAKEASTPAVFTTVTLDKDLTATQKATASTTPNIVVNAYGIQIDNLGTPTPSPATIYGLFNS